MRKSRFSETKIVNILKEAETGVCTVEETCRKHGISSATYYKWRSKFGAILILCLSLKQIRCSVFVVLKGALLLEL